MKIEVKPFNRRRTVKTIFSITYCVGLYIFFLFFFLFIDPQAIIRYKVTEI